MITWFIIKFKNVLRCIYLLEMVLKFKVLFLLLKSRKKEVQMIPPWSFKGKVQRSHTHKSDVFSHVTTSQKTKEINFPTFSGSLGLLVSYL